MAMVQQQTQMCRPSRFELPPPPAAGAPVREAEIPRRVPAEPPAGFMHGTGEPGSLRFEDLKDVGDWP